MSEHIIALAKRLELLCKRILEANGYQVVSTNEYARVDSGADIVALEPDTKLQIAIEVKLYRSPRIDRQVLRNAAIQIVHLKRALATKGMFIATTTLDESDRRLLRNIGVDEYWDLSELRRRANIDIDLGLELEKLLRDAELKYATSVTALPDIPSQQPPSAEIELKGEKLIEKLHGTVPGSADAHKFENICTECIQYLFGQHFGQFHAQKRVEHGFHYMDLVARLIPNNTASFWVSLAQDFRCRYVVFEFKNYSDQISQNQIYTTEKYLYPNALRSVAIRVARTG
jgi:hypothetical protein